MLKFFKKYNVEIACYSCIILLLVSMICCTFDFRSKETTYADYEDILLNDNAIVNFNQLIPNEYINYTYDNNFYTIQTFTDYIPLGHTIYFNYVGSGVLLQYYDGTYYYDFTDNYFTLTANMRAIRLYSNVNNNTINYLNVIDLTQMFGGNEPNLQQCQELFVADYYPYNSGTSISFSGINEFQRGFNSAWESQDVTFNQNVISQSAFPYNFGTYSLSEKYYDDSSQIYGFRGVLGIPLTYLNKGSIIDFDLEFVVSAWSGESLSFKQSFRLNVYYKDSENNLVYFGEINYYDISANNVIYRGSVTLPIDLDTIYLYFTANDNAYDFSFTPTQAFVFQSDLTFRTQNLQLAIENAYRNGRQSVLQNLQEGNSVYNTIYQKGWQDGVDASNDYTFKGLITAVVDTPLKAFTTMFDFDILGVNMKTFYLSLFTLCMIITIIRLVL